MGVIMHNNIPYGGGSSIEPNPQESATEQLETLGIDGDVYEVTDANAAREVQETITEAQSRANLADGDSVPTIFGKIKKFFSDLKTVAFTGAYSDLSGTPTIPTVNDGTLTIQKNGTNVQTFSANQSGNATANIECANPSDVEGSKVATGNPLTITDAAGIKVEKIEITFEPKQAGSGTPSPSNIRPITGYTSISADECKKNMIPNGTDSSNGFVDSSYIAENGTIVTNSQSLYVSEYFVVTPNTAFTFSSRNNAANAGAVCFYDDAKQFISGKKCGNTVNNITTPSNAYYARSTQYKNTSDGIMQFEKGTVSAPTYESYQGDSVTIQLGQTLYGGKLTILQDGSADIYCDRAIYNMPTTGWINNTTNASCLVLECSAPDSITVTNADTQTRITCDFLEGTTAKNIVDTIVTTGYENTIAIISGNRYLAKVEKSIFASKEAFMTYISNNSSKAVYELNNPFTIHLSPVETLMLLQGINNVWTDGTTLSLTYQPDNAIGQAKGTAQDAMAMVNALASTAVKVIAKKGQYEMGVRDWVDMPDCSLSLDKGTYVIIGWLSCNSDMLYYNGNYYRYGCAICDSSNNRLVCNTFLPSTTTEIVYGGTISTFYYEKITSDATVRKLKGYMPYTLSGSKIAYGGIVAIKIA